MLNEEELKLCGDFLQQYWTLCENKSASDSDKLEISFRLATLTHRFIDDLRVYKKALELANASHAVGICGAECEWDDDTPIEHWLEQAQKELKELR